MKRGNIVIILFILLAGAIVLFGRYLLSRPPMVITVAVEPLLADWVRATAENFNEQDTIITSNRRIAVQITVVDDIDVWTGETSWTDGLLENNSRPSVWIPALAISENYAQSDSRLKFTQLEPSVAKTLLVWGGFEERITALPDNATLGLGWSTVAPAAEIGQWSGLGADPTWQFFDLAFLDPTQTTSGLSVLLSGAAAYHETNTLNSAQLRDEDFRNWITPVLTSVPNFSTLGNDPAEAIAQRGLSIADIALLPESQWIVNFNSLTQVDNVAFAYPEFPVMFDFPILAWESTSVTTEERAAIQAFADYVLSSDVQATLIEYGLRDANGTFPESTVSPLPATPYLDNAVQPPTDRSAIQALLTWYGQIR